MKKTLKMAVYIIIGLIFFLGIVYLYLTDFGKNKLLSNKPLKPKYEVPITYTIGWWSYQNQMTVESIEVKMIENNLNLYNNKSLISYKISGELKYSGYWKPYINKVHISERIGVDSLADHYRIIELTPIVKVKKDKSQKDGIVRFNFTNEHSITSGGWGNNKIKIKCSDKEEVIEFNQLK